jgi:hypothetical protein
MIALATVITTVLILEIVVAITICIWQEYKEDIQWFIYTLMSGRD